MKQELLTLQWRPLLPSRPLSSLKTRCSSLAPISTSSSSLETSSSSGGELTAKERRQLRKERREIKAGDRNWREEVEERLLVKPKKEYRSWTEKLNLDTLARLGPQWWVVRVSRVIGHETAEALARALIRNFPQIEFKVYFPAVKEQRKLKNGSYSVKVKPLFPGCVFLNCVLNKEIHDFIRDFDGVGGFVGSKVGNTKRQINKPKPVVVEEMEAIFRKAKEEQEKSDQEFEEEKRTSTKSDSDRAGSKKPTAAAKPGKRLSRKALKPSDDNSPLSGEDYESLTSGATVRVLSGPFSEYKGRLKKLDKKNGKAIVGFMLFGKESFVELEVKEIVAENT